MEELAHSIMLCTVTIRDTGISVWPNFIMQYQPHVEAKFIIVKVTMLTLIAGGYKPHPLKDNTHCVTTNSCILLAKHYTYSRRREVLLL